MSNEVSSPRKVVPYQRGKRISTIRKLDVDFAGTALEQALRQIAIQEKTSLFETIEPLSDTADHDDRSLIDTGRHQIPVSIRDRYPLETESSYYTKNLTDADHECHRSVAFDQSHQHQTSDVTEFDKTIETSKNESIVSDTLKKDALGASHRHPLDTGVQQIPVSQIPVSNRYQSISKEAKVSKKRSPPAYSEEVIQEFTDPKSHFLKVPNSIGDGIFSILDPYEFKVYFRLFRLSHGFHQVTCFIGLKALSESTGISVPHLKRVIPKLIRKGVIQIANVFNTSNKKGTEYHVLTYPLDTGIQQRLVSSGYQSKIDTGIQQTPNKRHDDQDLKETDHHQNARARADDGETTSHFQLVKSLYEEITGNVWKPADTLAYRDISEIPAAEVQAAMRRARERASARPNTFKFFIREIKNGCAATGGGHRDIDALARLAKEIRSTNTGRFGYTEADFREDLKIAAARSNVRYTSDLFDEAMASLARSVKPVG